MKQLGIIMKELNLMVYREYHFSGSMNVSSSSSMMVEHQAKSGTVICFYNNQFSCSNIFIHERRLARLFRKSQSYKFNHLKDMDPITAVSFAVAVAQAADIAAKTCKMIYRFQDRVGSAPADIVQLTLDLDTLRTLLVEVDAVTREIRDDENVSPELLTLWTRKERSLLQDLLSIQQLADRLVELLNGPTVTSLQLRARLRIACSEKTVSRFHESVFKHIEFLGMLHGLLNRYVYRLDWQLHELRILTHSLQTQIGGARPKGSKVQSNARSTDNKHLKSSFQHP